MAQLVEFLFGMHEVLGSMSQHSIKSGVVTEACTSNSEKLETEGQKFKVILSSSEFEVSLLGYRTLPQ